jgi:hypothetical protein
MGALGALIKAASCGSAILGIDQVGKYHNSFGVKPSDFWVCVLILFCLHLVLLVFDFF